IVFGNNAADGQVVRGNTVELGSLGSAAITGPTMPINIIGNSFLGRDGRGTAIWFVGLARSGVVIEGNTITNWDTGIFQPDITAVWPAGSAPIEVHHNNFAGNRSYAVSNNTPPGEYDINASCNW